MLMETGLLPLKLIRILLCDLNYLASQSVNNLIVFLDSSIQLNNFSIYFHQTLITVANKLFNGLIFPL